jgi:hypothetical protein
MSNIIDAPADVPGGPAYLKKSIKISRIYLALLILLFVLSSLAKLAHQFSDLLTILLGVSALALFGLSPWGLYYSWKSKKTNEGFNRKRLTYAILHGFMFALLVLVIVRFFMDVAILFGEVI